MGRSGQRPAKKADERLFWTAAGQLLQRAARPSTSVGKLCGEAGGLSPADRKRRHTAVAAADSVAPGAGRAKESPCRLRPAPVRRRLCFKQPPEGALSPAGVPNPAVGGRRLKPAPVRRRFRFKQPLPLVSCSAPERVWATPDELLHHARVLGVIPGASAQEVRAAYRTVALRSHPDKGGRREDFLAAHTAYQVLSESRLRGACDQEMTAGGPESQGADGALHEPNAPAPETFTLLVRLLDIPPEEWPNRVAACPRDRLLDLFRLLISVPNIGKFLAEKDIYKAPGKYGTVQADAGLTKVPRGYFVKVRWHGLVLQTLCTRDLEEVLEWHADMSLCRMRATAILDSGKSFEEAAHAFESFPHILQVSFDLRGVPRVFTPFVLSIRNALEARRRLLALQNDQEREAKIRRVVERLQDKLQETREAADARQRLLMIAVDYERRGLRQALPALAFDEVSVG
mmetsp:Transcript_14257/g.44540  ORF Transcript_14257/g.44540 Transcript_14257/m.44540 type:complete len:458 (-) Transcript_14257:157-1530(-)